MQKAHIKTRSNSLKTTPITALQSFVRFVFPPIHFVRILYDSDSFHPSRQQGGGESYCDGQGRRMVFKGLSRAHTRKPFKKWLKDAGIKKKITFHDLRHTYATLLISNGTDIYTVSKMLTHKNVATTQIYAEVVNQKKRDAANSISLK